MRTAHREEPPALIEETFANLGAEDVIARLDAADIANAHVSTMNDIWTHPQLEARGRWTTVDPPPGPRPAWRIYFAFPKTTQT